MIGSTRNLKVFAYAKPTDMRRGYNGLFAMARDQVGQDPLNGHAFLFVARNRKRCKVLRWDGTGLCIYMKRLEQGCFVAPWQRAAGDVVEMTMTELALFLEGSKAVLRRKLSPEEFFPRRIRSRTLGQG